MNHYELMDNEDSYQDFITTLDYITALCVSVAIVGIAALAGYHLFVT